MQGIFYTPFNRYFGDRMSCVTQWRRKIPVPIHNGNAMQRSNYKRRDQRHLKKRNYLKAYLP